jgi:hypothetical protein
MHLNQSTGWIEGKNGELVIWIPADIRSQLCLYPQLIVIGTHSILFQPPANISYYEDIGDITSLL